MKNKEAEYEGKIDLRNPNSSHTKLLKLVPRGSRVLEWGPASGYLTRWMKEEAGCRLVGVEIDAEAARKAEPWFERLIVEDADRLDFAATFPESGTFDVILFPDVLEHLTDPWRVVRECRRLLKDDGRMIASIPNVGHAAVVLRLIEGRFDYQPLGLLDRTHLRFFTRKSLRDLFEENGFVVTGIEEVKEKPETCELKVDPSRVDPAVWESLRRHPDHDTYQFVVVVHKAPDAAEGREACLRKKALEVEQDRRQAEARLRHRPAGLAGRFRQWLRRLLGG